MLVDRIKKYNKLSKIVVLSICFILVIPASYILIFPNLVSSGSIFTKSCKIIVLDSATKKVIQGSSVIIIWEADYTYFPDRSNTRIINDMYTRTDAIGIFKVPSKLRTPAINLFPVYYQNKGKVMALIFAQGYKYRAIDVEHIGNNTVELTPINNRKTAINEARSIQSILEIFKNNLSNKSYSTISNQFLDIINKEHIDYNKPYWLED